MSEVQVFGDVTLIGKEGIRDFISSLEEKIIEMDVQAEPSVFPITHHFSKGVYAREMLMPKGSMVVGKIHKHQNLCVISAGEVSILSIDGVVRVKAPYTFVASAGAKRVIYAHEETVWTVVHGTSETDVEKIENEFIAKTYDEVLGVQEKVQLKEGLCPG